LKDDILACVLKLEISYTRVIICWRIFGSFRGFFFWRLCIFLHGEIFEFFHNSAFALRYSLMYLNSKATMWHAPLLLLENWSKFYQKISEFSWIDTRENINFLNSFVEKWWNFDAARYILQICKWQLNYQGSSSYS
jgi:hypothetical protein